MHRPSYRTTGFTLTEVLVVMMIMSLVAGVVSSVYFASMQVWRRCSSQSQADPPAHMAIARITKELRNAYVVNNTGTNSITFTLPAADANGYNVLPLQPAQRISYYLSDQTGTPGHAGTVLWRQEQNLITARNTLRKSAENVEQLSFSYDATQSRVLKIYALSITVLGREGHEEYRSLFGSHVAFRN
jgi:prepilin-type N-terminal cleavage/methylation domain-containing protein